MNELEFMRVFAQQTGYTDDEEAIGRILWYIVVMVYYNELSLADFYLAEGEILI